MEHFRMILGSNNVRDNFVLSIRFIRETGMSWNYWSSLEGALNLIMFEFDYFIQTFSFCYTYCYETSQKKITYILLLANKFSSKRKLKNYEITYSCK